MNPEILKLCLGKGILLDREVGEILSGFDENTAREIVEGISRTHEKLITKTFFTKNAEKISEILKDSKVIDKLKINLGLSIEIFREREVEKKESNEENLKIIYSLANLGKKLEPEDFVKYFRARYLQVKQGLQERKELDNLTSISKINGQKQSISIIGMVFGKRVTKNKNIILEIEDLSGRISILVNKDKPIYELGKGIVVDDIIGIKGFGNQEIIFANELLYPELFLQEKNFLERDERAVFISDIHVGSNNFLEKNFLKFIDWINGVAGDEKQKEEARKVKYLFITGDTIDGVGIFPGQESLLKIKDIKEQYAQLAGYLSRIRNDVKIIISPGQHDAVRVAEPQPSIGKEYGASLHELENVVLVSNPAVIEITNNSKRGIKILMYHGASMNSYIEEIESLRLGKAHDFPAKVVREMLKRRHLASMHSSVTYIPNEKYDFLAINEVPDIINTADLHKPDVDIYNNILIVCSSCWQSITPFEEKVGNHPDPCKVPVINLKTREIKILDFSDDGEEKICEEEDGKMVCEAGK